MPCPGVITVIMTANSRQSSKRRLGGCRKTGIPRDEVLYCSYQPFAAVLKKVYALQRAVGHADG